MEIRSALKQICATHMNIIDGGTGHFWVWKMRCDDEKRAFETAPHPNTTKDRTKIWNKMCTKEKWVWNLQWNYCIFMEINANASGNIRTVPQLTCFVSFKSQNFSKYDFLAFFVCDFIANNSRTTKVDDINCSRCAFPTIFQTNVLSHLAALAMLA